MWNINNVEEEFRWRINKEEEELFEIVGIVQILIKPEGWFTQPGRPKTHG